MLLAVSIVSSCVIVTLRSMSPYTSCCTDFMITICQFYIQYESCCQVLPITNYYLQLVYFRRNFLSAFPDLSCNIFNVFCIIACAYCLCFKHSSKLILVMHPLDVLNCIVMLLYKYLFVSSIVTKNIRNMPKGTLHTIWDEKLMFNIRVD